MAEFSLNNPSEWKINDPYGMSSWKPSTLGTAPLLNPLSSFTLSKPLEMPKNTLATNSGGFFDNLQKNLFGENWGNMNWITPSKDPSGGMLGSKFGTLAGVGGSIMGGLGQLAGLSMLPKQKALINESIAGMRANRGLMEASMKAAKEGARRREFISANPGASAADAYAYGRGEPVKNDYSTMKSYG